MKQIIRRLTALALCAILMMAMPLASAQELMTPEGRPLTVQIVITQPDGTMSLLPVTPVTNTMGNTVYWVDESMLSDDEIASLSTAQLQLVSETGELYAEMPLLESGFAGAIDERLDIVNDMIPGGVLTVLPAETAAPMDGEEADNALWQYMSSQSTTLSSPVTVSRRRTPVSLSPESSAETTLFQRNSTFSARASGS